MKKTIYSLAVTVLAVPYLAAQQADPAAQREVAAAWRSFVQQQGTGDWHADWSQASGTPRAVYGDGLRLEPGRIEVEEDARRHATMVLERQAKLLGRGDSTFVESSYGKVNHTHVFVYEQRYKGLNVLDGRADIRINDCGVLAMWGSEAFAIPKDFVITPQVSENVAKLMACMQLEVTRENAAQKGRPAKKDRRLIWASRKSRGPCKVRLAWEITIDAEEQVGRAYVDARTGQFIEFREDRYKWSRGSSGISGNAAASLAPKDRPELPAPQPLVANVVGKVMGWLTDSISPNGALKNFPLGGIRVQVQGGASGFTDATGSFNIPHSGASPVSVTVSFSNARHVGSLTTGRGTVMQVTTTLTPGTSKTIQVYGATATEFERAQSTAYYLLDRVSEYVRLPHILGNNSKLATLDRIAVVVNSTQSSCNAGYMLNKIEFAHAGGQCPNMAFSTVVEHEWGHGLDDIFGGISGQGGLAEGWADVVTLYYTGQPLIGKDFQGPGQHVRNGNNTRAFGTGSTPHQQGESWMGGCWKLRQALISKLGRAKGQKHAETIVLGSLVANAATQPAAVREVYIADDNDGNLNNGTPNCSELFAAFTTTHKIPSPVRSCSATPGQFTTYGKGCPGTGKRPATCQAQNAAGGTPVPPPPPGTSLAYAVVAKQAMSVSAVSLYSKAVAGSSAQATIWLHRDASGVPAASAAVTATLTAAGSAGWYKASFTTPLPVKASERFFIVHSADKIAAALVMGGSAPASKTLARHPLFSPFWGPLPPMIPDFPAWKVECSGGGTYNAVPVLDSPDLPEISYPFSLELSFARANAQAAFLVGLSNTKAGPITLPLDLTPLGAKGCTLLSSFEVLVPVRTDAGGRASLKAVVPNAKSIVGITIYLQASVAEPKTTNPLGLAFSNAAAAKIGTR